VKPAIFLDRDGTVIEQVHHLVDPDHVSLIPGAAHALARLREHGFLCVIVTNQSVLGRGLLDVAGLDRVHSRMNDQLALAGAAVDAIYYCPTVPVGTDPTCIEDPDRKPGPGMLLRAAQELSIALDRSWMIGDSLSDLYAGENAGCHESLLVLTGYGQKAQSIAGSKFRSFPTIGEAAAAILAEARS